MFSYQSCKFFAEPLRTGHDKTRITKISLFFVNVITSPFLIEELTFVNFLPFTRIFPNLIIFPDIRRVLKNLHTHNHLSALMDSLFFNYFSFKAIKTEKGLLGSITLVFSGCLLELSLI